MHFAAEAEEELEFDGRLVVEVDGFEVEDVGLDGEGGFTEGGTISDVGDGLEAPAIHSEPGDVHAESGKDVLVGGKIDGGHQDAGADAATVRRSRQHSERPAEHPAGTGEVAGYDVLADCGA